MKFIGLRHGQSIYNLKQLCNDDPTKPVNLTPLGEEQARLAAEALRHEQLQKIFTSPLPRARQTAEIVTQVLNLQIEVQPAITDIRSGLEGQPVYDYLAAIAHAPLHAKVNDGESIHEQFQRVSQFLDQLYDSGISNVLLVAHEETLRVFKAWSEGLDAEAVIGLPFENCRPYVFVK